MKLRLPAPLATLLAVALLPFLFTSCADVYGYGDGYYGGYGGGAYDTGYYGGGYPYSSGYRYSSLSLGSGYYNKYRSRCSKCGHHPCSCGHHSSHKYYKGSKSKHYNHSVARHDPRRDYSHGTRSYPGSRGGADRRDHGDHSGSRYVSAKPPKTSSSPPPARTISRDSTPRGPSPRAVAPSSSGSRSAKPKSAPRPTRNIPVTTSKSSSRSSSGDRAKKEKSSSNSRGRKK